MFQTKIVEKIKRDSLYSITFFRNSCRLWPNVEKYGKASQTTLGNKIRRTHTPKPTRRQNPYTRTCAQACTHTRTCPRSRTHTQQRGFVNAFQCYVIRPLLVLFFPLSSVFVQRRVNNTCKLRPYLIKTLCFPLQKLTNLLRLVT